MRQPVLVLQYPDNRRGRTVALATTTNREVLMAFRGAVLEEANAAALTQTSDEVLWVNDRMELERLEGILDLIIPVD